MQKDFMGYVVKLLMLQVCDTKLNINSFYNEMSFSVTHKVGIFHNF